jgi:hypothetical protein
VISGTSHVKPTDNIISQIHFLIDDATSLFYDFDAFGNVIDARPFIDQIARANTPDREITTGPEPEILYFTGKREIFSTETTIGAVSAAHNLRRTFVGLDGLRLDNQIFLTIAFQELLVFEEAISRMFMLLRYLDILVGRPQNLLDVRLSIRAAGDQLFCRSIGVQGRGASSLREKKSRGLRTYCWMVFSSRRCFRGYWRVGSIGSKLGMMLE